MVYVGQRQLLTQLAHGTDTIARERGLIEFGYNTDSFLSATGH